jgi:hypothetical protein
VRKKVDPSIHNIVLLWLGWAFVMLAFQRWLGVRLDIERPDRVLSWTPYETNADSQNDKPYLIDPYLNHHVSWDSEFYLSIGTVDL